MSSTGRCNAILKQNGLMLATFSFQRVVGLSINCCCLSASNLPSDTQSIRWFVRQANDFQSRHFQGRAFPRRNNPSNGNSLYFHGSVRLEGCPAFGSEKNSFDAITNSAIASRIMHQFEGFLLVFSQMNFQGC
ncbi:hypothetical protein Xcab_00061 [Xenorhabdus cabanillasii JM26]|nr:hypothetical protein Xcab_00061 [Xenorhabdus cabanillasii JM26]